MGRTPNSSAQTRELLSVLVRRPRTWRYGYDLSKETGLKSGTLYPLLIRLSDRGLLESQWQQPERPGKPPRHAVRLTPDGVAFARSMAAPARRRLAGATS
jgi:DNA-binding PadR family transcriptional regulator